VSTPTAPPTDRLDSFIIKVGIVISLGSIMSILDTTIVAVATDRLAQDFRTSIGTIQWVTTGYLLALAIVVPVTGWAIHRVGSKQLFLVSIALFTAGSVLCGVAWSASSLIFFRFLQGLGGGMIMPAGQTIVTRAAGPQRMGRVMGMIGIPTVLGPILGPVLGGLIVSHFSWRWIFFVNVPIGIVTLYLARRVVPGSAPDGGHPFDLRGFLMLSPGFALVVFGLSRIGETGGWTDPWAQLTLWSGLALCVAFVLHALRARWPLLEVRLFGQRAFAISSSCVGLLAATLFGTIFLLPLYYQVVRGQSPLVAGLMMAPQGVGAGLMMKPAGTWADRRGVRVLAPVAIAVGALGTFAYTQVTPTSNLWLLGGALFVRGLGIGAAFTPVVAASYKHLTHDQIPKATTTINILRQIGASLGVALYAVILQSALHKQFPHASGSLLASSAHLPAAVADKLAAGFRTSFWWSFATICLVVVPTLFLEKGRLSQEREDFLSTE
jgi:EmrB/QacA subfamily drug resistance transporter